MKNNTSTGVDQFCGSDGATLLDQDGRNFDLSSNTIEISGNDICGDSLAPGFRKDYSLLFSLPRDAATEGIALWNSDSEDDFSGDTYVFVDK